MAARVNLDVSEVITYSVALDADAARVQALASVATHKAGSDIERDAKILAPVDTGFLRNSISTTTGGGGASTTAEVGPTANYAEYVESGTSRMAPQPYLGPATDRHVPLWQRALEQIAAGTV